MLKAAAQNGWLDHDAVIIGEVFRKKTPSTPGPVIATCKRWFEAYDR
jgi:hypothetical protein